MKRRTLWLLLAASVSAQAQPAANGLEALLQQVQQAAQQQAALSAQRERQFLQARDRQAQLLAQAQAEEKAAQARADKLRAAYDANQKTISELQQKLASSSGDRGQLDAAVRDAARDFRELAGDSLVSAQYPQRLKTLDRLSDPQSLPSVADLRDFWFLLQQQLVASAQVARFDAKVVDVDGTLRPAVVTRIGEFTALSGDSALVLQPHSSELEVLRRQPAGFAAMARDYARSRAAVADMLVDPSRGKLLRLAAQRPTLLERIDQAGAIGYVIIAVGVIGLGCAVYQFFYLAVVGARVRRQLKRLDVPSADNPLGRVLGCLRDAAEEHDPEVLETRLSEAVLREAPRLERFQSFLRMVVAAGPLLGLLGTVTGMIRTFQVITEAGAADPKLMAGGIGQAMVATVLGLLVAIPNLFINSLLASRSRVLVQTLDEQSAGLLARRLEAQHERRHPELSR